MGLARARHTTKRSSICATSFKCRLACSSNRVSLLSILSYDYSLHLMISRVYANFKLDSFDFHAVIALLLVSLLATHTPRMAESLNIKLFLHSHIMIQAKSATLSNFSYLRISV